MSVETKPYSTLFLIITVIPILQIIAWMTMFFKHVVIQALKSEKEALERAVEEGRTII